MMINIYIYIRDTFFCCAGERELQKSYWMEHSVDLTVEAMMLDSHATELDKEERPEVLVLFPLELLLFFCFISF